MESVRKALGENLSRIRRRKRVAGATLAVAVLLLSAAVLIPSIQSEPEGYSGDYYTVTYNIGAVPTVAGHNESTGATSSINPVLRDARGGVQSPVLGRLDRRAGPES